MEKEFPYAAASACATAGSYVAPDSAGEQSFGLFLRRGRLPVLSEAKKGTAKKGTDLFFAALLR